MTERVRHLIGHNFSQFQAFSGRFVKKAPENYSKIIHIYSKNEAFYEWFTYSG